MYTYTSFPWSPDCNRQDYEHRVGLGPKFREQGHQGILELRSIKVPRSIV